jgi:hypothetical protein
MSCAPDLSLCLPVGTAPSWTVAIVIPDQAAQVVDITGATFVFIVKPLELSADSAALFSLTSGGGEIVIADAALGLLQIDVTAAKASLLTPPLAYFWQLRMTLPSGEIRIVRKGKLASEYGVA